MHFSLVPHQCKCIAADAVGAGLDHRQGRGRGDRRVNRVAARLQHLKARLSGQWL